MTWIFPAPTLNILWRSVLELWLLLATQIGHCACAISRDLFIKYFWNPWPLFLQACVDVYFLLLLYPPSFLILCHVQRRPKAPPATQNASQKSPGDKNKEVGGGTKFKIVAIRCHILRLKCTKFDFGWGSAPDPAGGAHSAPQTP